MYHSEIAVDTTSTRRCGSIYIIPFKVTSGNAKTNLFSPIKDVHHDIIDECLLLFRINSYFKSFAFNTPMDPLLVYGLLYIGQILSKLRPQSTYAEAVKITTQLSFEKFAIPGVPGTPGVHQEISEFPLNQLYETIEEKGQVELLRTYLTLFRQELASRLLSHVYVNAADSGGASPSPSSPHTLPSKWWITFQKRRFMNKAL